MKRDKIALRFKDWKNRDVVWYEESYTEHLAYRPELKQHKNIISKALQKPKLKYIDRKRKSTNYFYPVRIDKKGDQLYMEVIVNYNKRPAIIRTAFLTSNVKQASVVY